MLSFVSLLNLKQQVDAGRCRRDRRGGGDKINAAFGCSSTFRSGVGLIRGTYLLPLPAVQYPVNKRQDGRRRSRRRASIMDTFDGCCGWHWRGMGRSRVDVSFWSLSPLIRLLGLFCWKFIFIQDPFPLQVVIRLHGWFDPSTGERHFRFTLCLTQVDQERFVLGDWRSSLCGCKQDDDWMTVKSFYKSQLS